MDLLATVRKEGSRGGRGEFKWSDVQNSSHRENYLGHSVMAPVGRWQKGRDLNWYAKAETDEDAAEKAAQERREEIRRVKEAEQDAMARALGLPVPDRSNANLQEVSNKREFNKVLKETMGDEANEGSTGIGFNNAILGDPSSQVLGERIEGNAEGQDKELQYALREYKRRHGDKEKRRRSRSRSRDRHPKHRERERDERRDHRSKHEHIYGYSSRRERHRRRHSRSDSKSRSRSRSRDRDRKDRDRRRERSRSPYQR